MLQTFTKQYGEFIAAQEKKMNENIADIKAPTAKEGAEVSEKEQTEYQKKLAAETLKNQKALAMVKGLGNQLYILIRAMVTPGGTIFSETACRERVVYNPDLSDQLDLEHKSAVRMLKHILDKMREEAVEMDNRMAMASCTNDRMCDMILEYYALDDREAVLKEIADAKAKEEKEAKEKAEREAKAAEKQAKRLAKQKTEALHKEAEQMALRELEGNPIYDEATADEQKEQVKKLSTSIFRRLNKKAQEEADAKEEEEETDILADEEEYDSDDSEAVSDCEEADAESVDETAEQILSDTIGQMDAEEMAKTVAEEVSKIDHQMSIFDLFGMGAM